MLKACGTLDDNKAARAMCRWNETTLMVFHEFVFHFWKQLKLLKI